ncbi:ABC transporter ATP-binding protein [Bacillus atrophaeus]|uniref:ABC transporter ATP-binding protein n=1 Tax=Bacillus atrophaeus TaxID=1452 RepID=UPI001C122B10|nr:ABC transporter ATP-binding protein [Bacillus atrophaeus]MBU5262765.1 ABC transporter ATP-binding protein [Bacillus atrophaeus]
MIEVENLEYTYPGKKSPTIKGVNFDVKKGEIFGFLGPSGAGKSTIQKIIIGILKGYQGQVRIMGQNINELDANYYEKIGVSFELPNLYTKFTAMENLSFFRSLYAGKTNNPVQLLESVGLGEHANTKVSNFSKGMKMRLNFCRAFLNNADLIFLDEPTSGLDPTNARLVKEIILEKQQEEKTILITTHNMSVAAEICDRVAFIVDGQVALIDSPRALKLQYGKKQLRLEYLKHNTIKKEEFPLEGIGENKSFLELLKSEQIERMHTQEATLEDIFIKVTGKKLD